MFKDKCDLRLDVRLGAMKVGSYFEQSESRECKDWGNRVKANEEILHSFSIL